MAIDLTFRRVAAVLIAITSTGLVAQTPAAPSAPVDLSSPALQAHASLPLNDQPGVPLNDMLVGTQPRATALGLSNDLTGGPIDEVVVSPSGGPHISDIYQQRTCKADAIIIGHITNSASHLNTSGTTVYTDYDFVLDGILKDNAQARIAPRKDIVVTRIGGSISLPNGTITYNHGGFPPFQPTATYLVFASYIPASGGYVSNGSVCHFGA